MLAPLTHRKPAWIVARGGACLRFGVRPNAFGNALGDSFVGMMRPTPTRGLTTGEGTIGLTSGPSGEGMRLGGLRGGSGEYDYTAAIDDGYQIASSADGRGVSTDNAPIDRYGRVYGPLQGREFAVLPDVTVVGRRDVDLGSVTVTGQRQSAGRDYAGELYASGAGDVRDTSPAAGLEVDPSTGLASFAYTSRRMQSEGVPQTVGATDLSVGIGFGGNAIQSTPQWVDAVGDSRIRLDYYKTSLDGIPETYRLGPDATIDQLRPNAEAAHGERNAVLDETRTRISQQGLSWSEDLKAKGQPFKYFEDKYARKLGENPSNPGPDTYREIIERSGKSNTTVTNTAKALVGIENGLNVVAKPLMVVGAGLDGYSLGTEINRSINSGNWQNTGRESARIAGAWTVAWAGAEAGALGGAVVGAWTGPLAPLAVPALTLIGGLGGGIVGYWKGGQAGQYVYNFANGSR